MRLQGFDEETKRTDGAGNLAKRRLAGLRIRRRRRIGECPQGRLGVRDCPGSAVLVEHGQRAADLVQDCIDRCQRSDIGRFDEIVFKHFFDLAHACLQLTGQGDDGLALLCLTGHVVEPRRRNRHIFAADA